MNRLCLYMTVLWALSRTGGAIQCQRCTGNDPLCPTRAKHNCTNGITMCLTAYIKGSSEGTGFSRVHRDCAPAGLCSDTGPTKYSFNLGMSNAAASAVCCNTDNCNTQTLTFPVSMQENGLQCPGCSPSTSDCSSVAQCRGLEDTCFQTTLRKTSGASTVSGCLSEDLCDFTQTLLLFKDVGTFDPVSICNSASILTTTTAFTSTTESGTSTTFIPTTATATTITAAPVARGTPAATAASQTPTFQCQTSTDPQCSHPETVTCSSETMCITASIRDTTAGNPTERIYKGCAPPSVCPAVGSETYSISLGLSRERASAMCCNTSNCNAVTLGVPPPPTKCGLQCYFCLPGDTDCSVIVQCEGEEDRCFQGNITRDSSTFPVAGCTSHTVCEAAERQSTLPFIEALEGFSSGPKCCGTSLCNSFKTSTTSQTTTMAPMKNSKRLCAASTDPQCSSQVTTTCSAETMCITASILDTSGNPAERIYKGCAPSSLCPMTGSDSFSVTLGLSRLLASVQCCGTDNCNAATLSVPARQPTNNLKCYFCLPGDASCSVIVSCEGKEDSCFQGTVLTESGSSQVAGCVSTNVCEAAQGRGTLPFINVLGNFISGPNCCGTSLCNSFMAKQTPTTGHPALQCKACTDPQCSREVTMSCCEESRCITASIHDTSGYSTGRVYKGCAPIALCRGSGPETYSVSLGFSRTLASVQCCDSNNCNSGFLPMPTRMPRNGLQCLICLPGDPNCAIDRCEGNENSCLQGTVMTDYGSSAIAGCTSSKVCDADLSLWMLLFGEGFGYFINGPTCGEAQRCRDVPEPPTFTKSPTIPSLQCLTCTDSQCSQEVLKPCSLETMCITASIRAFSDESTSERIYKGCAASSLCPASGSQVYSVDLGHSRALASVTCCNTDKCNYGSPPVQSLPPRNGQQCSFCVPGDSHCTVMVQCRGAEDRCIERNELSYSSSFPAVGCSSPNMCGAAPDLWLLLFGQKAGHIHSGPSCCEGSFCNSPSPPLPPPVLTTTKPATTTKPCKTHPPTTIKPPKTGSSLQCLTCKDPQCSIEVPMQCTLETMCVTASILAFSYGTPPERIYKGCAPYSLCPETGSQHYSADLGHSRAFASVKCCDTDKCNSENPPVPTLPPRNGHQCHFCVPGDSNCSVLVQCRGEELNCLDGNANTEAGTTPALGCVSGNMCEAPPSLWILLFGKNVGDSSIGPRCCEGSLCNGPGAPAPTPKATGLYCRTCKDSTCSDEVSLVCPSDSMCITASILATSPGTPSVRIYKGCAASSLCPTVGYRTFSSNAGFSRALVSAKCCNEEDCNTDTLDVPTPQPLNGLRCFFCIPGTSQCSYIVHCQGQEDSCFRGTVTSDSSTHPIVGCTSSNVCEASPSLETLPFLRHVGQFSSGPTCCSTDLCNGVPTAITPPPFTAAPRLECRTCTDPSCSAEVSMPCSSSESMCITASILATSPGTPLMQIYKGCATSSLCPSTGLQTFSTNVGFARARVSTKCCNTRDCNTDTLPIPTPQDPNGRQCYFCIPGTNTCSFTVRCQGEEDSCFTGTMTRKSSSYAVIGCTTSNICDAYPRMETLPFLKDIGQFSSGPTCCHTDLCNGVTTTPALPAPAGPIRCLTCTDSTCSSHASVECSSETMCITASILATLPGTPATQIFKGCAPPSLCPSTGPRTFSTNVGFARALVSAKCCNTPDCNSDTLPIPSPQSPNSRQCLFCLPGTDQCSSTVQCEGEEDYCFHGIVTNDFGTSPVLGCTSAKVCDTASGFSMLPFMPDLGEFESGPSCCGTDLCNDNRPTDGENVCMACEDELCSSEAPTVCPADTMCITASILVTSTYGNAVRVYKGCAASSMCPATGPRTFSTSVAGLSTLVNAKCCDTWKCNAGTEPVPTVPAVNGHQCFICLPGSSHCSVLLQCRGEEDRCFHGTVASDYGTSQVLGCTSRDACEAASSTAKFPFVKEFDNFTSGPSCCDTNMCNSVAAPTVGPITNRAPAATAEGSTAPQGATGSGLQCLTCTDQFCSNEELTPCPSNTMCVSAFIRVFYPDNSIEDRIYKGCAPTAMCPSAGPRTFSTNLAESNTLVSAECCDTDSCNTDTLAAPTRQLENGLECFFCVSETGDCTYIVQCEGDQNRCFHGNMTQDSGITTPVVGCTSASVCEAAPGLDMLPFMEDLGSFSSGPTCCAEDLCNDITNTGPRICRSCTGPQCNSTVATNCSSETMCITATVLVTTLGIPTVEYFKGCAPPSLCPVSGPMNFSTNMAGSTALVSAECCDSDDCNNRTLPAPASQPINGHQCFFCLPETNICSYIVQCQGDEDYCFQGNVTNDAGTFPLVGCSSRKVCNIAPGLGWLPLMEYMGHFTNGPTCCDSMLCNDITRLEGGDAASQSEGVDSSTSTSSAGSVRLELLHLFFSLLVFPLLLLA